MGDDAQKELIATTDGFMLSDMGAFLDVFGWKFFKTLVWYQSARRFAEQRMDAEKLGRRFFKV